LNEQERQNRKKGQEMKVIYTAHGFHFFHGAPIQNWLFYYPVERWLAHYTDILITINEEDYQRAKRFSLRKTKGKRGKIFKVNGVGVDVEFYQKIALYRKECKEKTKGEKIPYLLVSIGELNKNKNHKVVIQAMARSKKEICYVICGEGKNRNYLEKLIQKYGLNQRVFLLGYRNDVTELLKIADVFVLPSKREGLSLSLQEAMACGLPAIVSNIRGNRDLITEEKGGWLIRPNDKKRLAEIIETLDKADLKKMGNYNKEKIAAYDKKQIANRMRKVYRLIDKETE